MKVDKIYILHSFNGRLYFEAVDFLCKQHNIKVEYRETNFFKLIVKLLLGRHNEVINWKNFFKNLIFFFKVPFMKGETIIYGTAPYDLRFLWYSLLKRRNRIIYHTSHVYWGNDNMSTHLYGFMTKLFKYLWMKSLTSNNILRVAVTKKSAESLEKFTLNKYVFQIYHSISVENFLIENKVFDKKLRVLFVGRLVYEKGIDILLDVIHNLTTFNIEFTIVGDGTYKDRILELNGYDNVEYKGFISDKKELSKIFKSHHILLNPSIRHNNWEELFGLVNIEAMAAGIVVIASNHIGPSEIISNNSDGFLVPENSSDEIIKILKELYRDRALLKKISNNAIQRANDFSLANIADKWSKIFE